MTPLRAIRGGAANYPAARYFLNKLGRGDMQRKLGTQSMFYRQARLARIYDGPDEVHKVVVARRILAQYEGKRTGR